MRKPRRCYRRGSAPVGLKSRGVPSGNATRIASALGSIADCVSISRPNPHVTVDAGIPAPAAVAVVGEKSAAPEAEAPKAVVEVSAAEVPAGEMGVSSAPAAAASAMAAGKAMAPGKAMAAAMSTSVATAMPASVATATSAGGRKGWARATAAPMAAVTAIAITVFRDMGASSFRTSIHPGAMLGPLSESAERFAAQMRRSCTARCPLGSVTPLSASGFRLPSALLDGDARVPRALTCVMLRVLPG